MVVALGGNAILQPGQVGTFEEQLVNVDQSCRRIARLVADGWRVVLTHGNGPQVGNILIQNDLAAKLVAPMPMDVCGAETQGQIGYMLQQSLHNHMVKLRLRVPVATFLTEVVVDQRDPAFAAPSKPVGPFYPEARAKELAIEQGLVVREDAGRGWRRVVPSPAPDRDRAAAGDRRRPRRRRARACATAAAAFPSCVTATARCTASRRSSTRTWPPPGWRSTSRPTCCSSSPTCRPCTSAYKTPGQRALARVSVAEMERYQAAGEFKAGSMGPKVEAALQFARAGGRAVIASLLDVAPALRGQAGTTIAGSR